MTSNSRKAVAIFLILLSVLLGSFAATQWLGSQFNYDSSLGEPLFRTAKCPIYAPWMVFIWGRILAAEYPAVISRAYTFVAMGGVVGVLSIIFLNLWREKGRTSANVFGSAIWGGHQDLKRLGLLNGNGIFLGQLPDGRYLRHDGPEHYAVIAPTRSGKGAGVVVPTLLSWKESALIYDLKEENWRITAGRRSQFSHVIYFNPNSRDSAHFNPLLEVRKGILEVRDVQNIADMIVDPDGSGFSDHWIKTGHSLLVATILHLLYAGRNEEKSLSGAAAFLSRAEKTLSETLNEMREFPHLRGPNGEPMGTHPVVAAAARDMLNKAENERSGVLSTAMSFLTLYRDPIVAENTRDSDFRISDLVRGEKPLSLYLVVPPSDINRLRPLIRLVVNQICKKLTEELNPVGRQYRLLLMLDEFPALGRLDFFENALGFIAGYGLKAMLISQSINQVRKVYGERNSILDNTHVRLFYAPNTVETAEYISKSLGQTTISFKTRSESGQKGSPFFTGKNVSTHFSARPLMTSGEVMELGAQEALLFIGGEKPLRCNKVRYFEDDSFRPLLYPAPKIDREQGYQFGPATLANEWFDVGRFIENPVVTAKNMENDASPLNGELTVVNDSPVIPETFPLHSDRSLDRSVVESLVEDDPDDSLDDSFI